MSETLRRRLVTIPILVATWLAWVLLLPLALPLLALVDLACPEEECVTVPAGCLEP